MVIMNIQLDNLLLFHHFSVNLSFPKKPVHSSIEEEHLSGRTNFRYKKLVVLMGANATGKTALGKVLMGIFNFISKKDISSLISLIDNNQLPASFSVDLAFPDCTLYRISTFIKAKKNINEEYVSDDLNVTVKQVKIYTSDSYETCIKRLDALEPPEPVFYAKALESVPPLSWFFDHPFASAGRQRTINPANPHLYAQVLQKTLQTLDPRIIKVEKPFSEKNTFSIVYPNDSVLIHDGTVVTPEKLSSRTQEGIGIAQLITGMKLNAHEFYYCDEKFSHIHTEIEKTFLSVMIDLLRENQQLFFTTHNLDILEMDLPLHSFAFLRRDESESHDITCVFASEYLKKNNLSLRNAVENDLFSTVPSTSEIYPLAGA